MTARFIICVLGSLLFLLPGLREPSVTYLNYAIQAGQMACSRYEYHSEPAFLLLLSAATYFAELLQLGDCDTVGAEPLVLAPIMLSLVGCIAMACAIRTMGVYALMFISFIVLDGASSMLPFHLLRQFLSLVVFASVFFFVINDKLDKGTLLFASLLAALIHFSGWLLVLLTTISFFVAHWFEPGTRRCIVYIRGREGFLLIGAMLAVAFLSWAYTFVPEYVSTKMTGHFSYPFSAVVQMIGEGYGLVFFAKQLFLFGGLYVLSTHSKSLFLSAFYLACGVTWFVVLALGVDSVIFNRVLIMIPPLVYLGFLTALSHKRLSPLAELSNVIFLAILLGAYLLDAKPL